MGQNVEEIQKLKEMLLLSERRYEIAMSFSDVTVFDYNVQTKKIITQHTDYEIFGMPATFEQGVEEVIDSGIIATRSHYDIRNLYRQIDEGVPSARTTVFANALDGSERVLDLLLVNIFGKDNKPIYAVGVRKDITDVQMLKKERNYGNIIMSDWNFVYEASINRDMVLRYDQKWVSGGMADKPKSFTHLVFEMSEKIVAPEHIEMVRRIMAPRAIEEAFINGKRIINFEYRRLAENGEYQWVEQSINIIKDDMTKEINIRCYLKNIDERKKKEEHVINEQHFYESMVSNVDSILEVGISDNTIVLNNDKLFLSCINGQCSYDIAMNEILNKIIHPSDKERFKEVYLRENVISAYKKGQREITCEYQIADENGDFKWINSIMHIFENPQTGELKGFVYSRDIDKAKKEHLELIYKSQHDMLTRFYNKATFEEKIREYLSTSEAKAGRHAFIILDVDHFKTVNDTLGHAFGDAILSQTAAKMSMMFRTDDLLGRIGGDEFVVFIKNISNEKAVTAKVKELCENLTETYTQNEMKCVITTSIGIALFNEHGKAYEELYRHADIALYHSKKNGRNRFSIFNNTMIHGTTSIKAIDNDGTAHAKAFADNINDYVFRILYENSDKKKAINSVLELVGKHFNCSRVYISEESSDGLKINFRFEWCKTGIFPRCEETSFLKYSDFSGYKELFSDGAYLFIDDVANIKSKAREYLIKDGIKSVMQFPISLNNKFVGVLGMDQCYETRVPKKEEIIEFYEMADVLGIFISEMRAIEEANAAKQENRKLREEIEKLKSEKLKIKKS